MTLPFCNRSCSKGRAGLVTWPTSKRPGALPAQPHHKSPNPKGKAGPDHVATSKLPGALPAPHHDKSDHSKGEAGPQNALTTSKLQDALPAPKRYKPKCSTGTHFAEATAQLPNALPRPLFQLLLHSSAPEQIRQSRGLSTCASPLWPPDALCPRHRPRKIGRSASPWTLAT